jgi:hypothetical protein
MAELENISKGRVGVIKAWGTLPIYTRNLHFPHSYRDNPGSIRRIFSMLWRVVSSEGESFTTASTGMSLFVAYLILVPSF